jgi:endonuclease/exonuclease/phosphatase family metal-dependent hydrolase
MGLLVFPAPYLGTDREGAIEEIVQRIREFAPDVVGLCEVFADGERELIARRLRDLYPHTLEGPDEADLESDGGLVVLSRHPILASSAVIYRDCAGADCLANKGVIHLRVQPPASPTACDVFFSHTQNIEEKGGREALYRQISALDQMIAARADPDVPTFVMGDLNIPGETRDYDEFIARLHQPVDVWKAQVSSDPGLTFVSDNNFYAKAGDNPRQNLGLDYILLRAGRRFVPLLGEMKVLRLRRGARFISDHFGLFARFRAVVDSSL